MNQAEYDKMATEFPIGTRVEIKSGGPDMTVNAFVAKNGITLVECCWFDGDDHAHNAFFHWKTLVLIDKERQ